MSSMAISNYLGLFILLMFTHPFMLVILNMLIWDKATRARYSSRFNIICAILAACLMIMHMQTEVVYGKELLDRWHSMNPDG